MYQGNIAESFPRPSGGESSQRQLTSFSRPRHGLQGLSSVLPTILQTQNNASKTIVTTLSTDKLPPLQSPRKNGILVIGQTRWQCLPLKLWLVVDDESPPVTHPRDDVFVAIGEDATDALEERLLVAYSARCYCVSHCHYCWIFLYSGKWSRFNRCCFCKLETSL